MFAADAPESESGSSSDETGRSSGSRSNSTSGNRQKRQSKKRATAIPVATPKVPALPLPPRNGGAQTTQAADRISPPDTDKGERNRVIWDWL